MRKRQQVPPARHQRRRTKRHDAPLDAHLETDLLLLLAARGALGRRRQHRQAEQRLGCRCRCHQPARLLPRRGQCRYRGHHARSRRERAREHQPDRHRVADLLVGEGREAQRDAAAAAAVAAQLAADAIVQQQVLPGRVRCRKVRLVGRELGGVQRRRGEHPVECREQLQPQLHRRRRAPRRRQLAAQRQQRAHLCCAEAVRAQGFEQVEDGLVEVGDALRVVGLGIGRSLLLVGKQAAAEPTQKPAAEARRGRKLDVGGRTLDQPLQAHEVVASELHWQQRQQIHEQRQRLHRAEAAQRAAAGHVMVLVRAGSVGGPRGHRPVEEHLKALAAQLRQPIYLAASRERRFDSLATAVAASIEQRG